MRSVDVRREIIGAAPFGDRGGFGGAVVGAAVLARCADLPRMKENGLRIRVVPLELAMDERGKSAAMGKRTAVERRPYRWERGKSAALGDQAGTSTPTSWPPFSHRTETAPKMNEFGVSAGQTSCLSGFQAMRSHSSKE